MKKPAKRKRLIHDRPMHKASDAALSMVGSSFWSLIQALVFSPVHLGSIEPTHHILEQLKEQV